MNLRKRAEAALARSLEGNFGLPVELVDPDGVEYSGLTGQVLYDHVVESPDTGQPVVVPNPVVTLRRSSLTRIPVANEKWLVRVPSFPDPDADLETYALSMSRPPEGGRSIGFIRIYLENLSAGWDPTQ